MLSVIDSAAPTRRLSNGVEYSQLLPIQVVGRAIMRPKLAVEGEQDLRWHIQRDGQTFAFDAGWRPICPLSLFWPRRIGGLSFHPGDRARR